MSARNGGFTLLEVLVAFVIAALAIGVMIDGVVGGLRSASAASQAQQATALARSRLAAAGAAITSGVPPGDSSGSDGAFRWRVHVAATGTAHLPRIDPVSEGVTTRTPEATLYGITVIVSWSAGTTSGRERQVRLDSARIGLPAATPGA